MTVKELKHYMKKCGEYGINPTLENLIKNLRTKDNAKYALRYVIRGE